MSEIFTAEDLRKIPVEPCPMCKARVKDWNGSDPKCSFPAGGKFVADGWNCATANAIRDICGGYEAGHPAADYRFCDDQKYATIQIDSIELETGTALALWVSWYKSRGRTDSMWILSDDEAPRLPTAADCEAIIAALQP